MLKLSPMLDWHKAIADLKGTVDEVHIVSVGGECKELLLVLAGKVSVSSVDSGSLENGVRVYCVDIMPKAEADGEYKRSEFCYTIGGAADNPPTLNPQPSTLNPQPSTLNSQFLLEPNASIMKAGCFAELSQAYGVEAIGPNSHLFVSSGRVEQFPGRKFAIEAVCTLNKRQLKQTLGTLKQANIAVRNFPMSVAELRKRLKLRDGGDTYIFATTTMEGEHVLIICHK